MMTKRTKRSYAIGVPSVAVVYSSLYLVLEAHFEAVLSGHGVWSPFDVVAGGIMRFPLMYLYPVTSNGPDSLFGTKHASFYILVGINSLIWGVGSVYLAGKWAEKLKS